MKKIKMNFFEIVFNFIIQYQRNITTQPHIYVFFRGYLLLILSCSKINFGAQLLKRRN